MKRVLTSLLTMLLLFAVGAQADYSIGERVAGNSAFKDGDLVVFEAASSIANTGYYIKETSSNSYAWQEGFDQASVWKVVVSSTTNTSFGTGTYYYLQNVQSGRYMAGTNTAPTTVESQSDAVLVAFYAQDTPWTWGKYDDQVNNAAHWDANSVAIRLVSGSNDYWLANDIGNRETGALPNNQQVHNFQWNAFYAVDNTPAPVVPDTLSELSQLVNNYVYTLTSKRGVMTVTSTAGAVVSSKKSNGTTDNPDASTDETASQWAVLTIDGTGYYLYNVLAQGFMTTSGSFSTLPKDAMTVQLANNPDGVYCFKITNGSNTLNNNNVGTIALDGWSTEDDGNRLLIQKAGDFDPSFLSQTSTLIWNVVDGDGNVVATDTVQGYVGREYTSTLATNSAITLATPKATMTADEQVITSTFTVNDGALPFKLSTSFDDATWYTVKIRGTKSLQYNGSTITDITSAPAQVSGKDIFAFVGTPFGFKIYNYAAGADAPFGPAVNTGASITAGAEANAGTFVYELSSENKTFQLLRYANNEIAYLNDVNSTLGVWLSSNNRHDAGSNFAFTQLSDEDATRILSAIDITWNVVDGSGNVLATETVKECAPGQKYAPSLGSYIGVTLATDSVVAPAKDTTVVTTYTFDASAYPFQLSASYNDAKWYQVTIRGSKYLTYNADNKHITDATTAPDAVGAKDKFAFVGTPFGFKLYNAAAGADAPFGPATASNKMKLVAGAADAAASLIYENNSNHQVFRFANASDGYVNDVNNELGVWKTTQAATDGGSTLAFIETVPDGYVSALANGYYYIVAGWDGMSLETRTISGGEYLYKHGTFSAPTKVEDLSLGQIFKVASSSDTTFTVQNVATGNYVGAYNAEGTEGTTLAFAATATAYTNYIYPWTQSPNATTDTGNDPYAPSFVVFDTSASENEWSGRWTGQGWNVHSVISDRPAHAFKFYKVDSLVTEYLANKDYYDVLLTYTNILNNTPTAAQDGDMAGNFKGPWIDGTERTAVAGYETVQNLKDSLSAAIDAYKANPSDETLAAMKLWGDTVNLKWAPLTDGVYFIIPRFGDDQTKSVVSLTIDTADSTAWRKPLAETDGNFMFEVKITKSHEDATLGIVPDSMTIKNIGSGLYFGKIVGNKWAYQTEPVQIGYRTFVGNDFYSPTKHAHCFGLNVGGTLMTFDQNENGSAITTTSGTYAWREAWMFRPADKYYEQYQQIDEAKSALRETIAANDSVEFGTDPGYYTEASVAALNDAIAAGQQALTSTDLTAVTKASDNITAAVAALKTVPITEGYYTIYVDNQNIASNNKSDKAMYFNSATNQVYWGEYVADDAKFVMKVTPGQTEGTYTVQSIANGLYGGNATAFCGATPLTVTPNALKFKVYAGTGSFVITGSDGAWDYCPQGNPDGKSNGPSYVWAYNGDRTANGGKPHLEWTWRLKALTDTAVVDTMLANSLATVVESMSEVTPGTDPNTYSEEAAKAYNAALAAAKTVAESGTVAEKAAALKSLFATSASITLNELTDGYYYIASAGNGPGYYTGSTVPSTNINLEDKDAIYNANGIVSWKAFDRTDKSQVYRITANANGGYDVYSLADSTYINKGARSYNTQISTSATPTTAQIFTVAAAGSGKYTITWSGNANVYALDHSHNGSTAATGTLNVWGNSGEAIKFGVNQWYVHALTQDEINSFAKSAAQEALAKAIEGDAGIADTTGASAVAKAYVEALANAKALAAEPAGAHADSVYEAALAAYQQAKAAYLEEQIQSGIAQAKWVLENTPTPTQDTDLASMGGTWINGTERTAVAGYETVQEYKDSLQAAITAIEDTITEANIQNLQKWGNIVYAKWAPLTDGVYFLIPRYGDDQAASVISMTIDTADSTAWRKPLTSTDPNFMFEVKITASHTDSILGTVPDSMTIKNIGTGLYLGKIVGSTWAYQTEPVNIGYVTFTGDQFYSDTKHAHCFGLNINNQFMTFSRSSSGSAITIGSTRTYAWMRAWMFRPAEKEYEEYEANKEFLNFANQVQASLATVTPANHHDNNKAKGRSFLLGNEKLGVDGLATSIDAINALQAAYDTLVAAYESGKSVSELTNEIAAVNAAKAVVDAKSNPMESGLYYIVAVYGDDTDSIPGGLVLTANGVQGNTEALSKTAFKATDANQIFQVTLLDSGKVTIQNAATGQYVGAVADGKWIFTNDAVELNIENANGGRYNWVWSEGATAAARSCSFALYTDASEGINSSTAANTQSDVYTIPAEDRISAWFCSWAFRPVGDSINIDALNSTIESLAGAYNSLVSSDEVGYYNKENVDAFKALYAEAVAQQAADTLSAIQKSTISASLLAAYNKALSVRNEVTTGYYIIKNTARGFGSNVNAMFIDEDGSVKWKAFDANDAKQFVFKVEDLDSTITISEESHKLYSFQSVTTDKYLGYGSAAQRGNATSSDTPWGLTVAYSSAAPQTMIQPVWMTRLALAQCYGVNTTATTSGQVRQTSALNADADSTIFTWVFVRADEYMQEDKFIDIYDIAADASAPAEGTTYVVKNAYNSKYLSTNGGTVAEVNTITNTEIWTIEASGKTVDNQPTYYLKSATQPDSAAYWQYEDYASKTWDATTPYDGYDWFGYAGLNAEFGPAATAQEFTILPATANADPDTRTAVASGKEPTGYVLTAAAKIMDKFYKLGVQGSNAAMEPYNEDVAWLFYEATGVEDADSALQIALNTYGQKEMKGGTAPGYYSADAVNEYNEIVSDAKSAREGTAAEKRASVQALLATDTMTFEVNPIVEGYYYIVSAGNGPGLSGGPYNNEEKFALYNNDGKVHFAAYDQNDTKYVYQFTGSGDTLMVKNIQDNSYIASYVADYGNDVLTSDGAAVGQVFTWEKEGKFAVNAANKQYVWATAGNHNGSTEASGLLKVWGTPAEAKTYGVNLWYLVPCSDEMIEKITGIGGIAAGGNGTSVVAGQGKVTVTSDKAQTILVVSTSGAVVARQQVAAGETTSIYLVPGVYIVNGKKVAVK